MAIVGILIVFGAGGYWAYRNFIKRPIPEPKPGEEVLADPTAGWETYTNATYAYKVKYPPDFYLHLTGYRPLPPYGVRFGNHPTDEPNPNFIHFEIDVTRETMPTPLDQFPEILDLISKGYIKTEFTISGRRAIKVAKPQAGLSAVVHLTKGNYSYRLALTTASVALGQASLDEFDLFVGSLEFY